MAVQSRNEASIVKEWAMRKQLFLCAALMLLTGIGAASAADEPAKPAAVDAKNKQYKVQGKFVEIIVVDGDKTETTTRIPAFVTLEGKKAAFHSGGSAALVGNAVIGTAKSEPYGFSMHLTVTPLGEADLVLDLSVENTQVTLDQKMTQAKSASLASTRKAKLAKSLKIVIEEDAKGVPRQWLEITIAEAAE
jgi:hypothetical protein